MLSLIVAGVLLVSGAAQAIGEPRENLRRGVEVAWQQDEASAAHVTAVLRQPVHYPHTPPLRIYASDRPRVEPDAVPERDGMPVIVLTRNTSPDDEAEIWVKIRAGRRLERTVRIDSQVAIHVFVAD